MTVFKITFLTLIAAGAISIALAWGGRASFVYLSFVGLTAMTSYGAAVGSELLRWLSARRFDPPRAISR